MNEFFSQLIETYAMFFDWQMWIEVLSDPVSWGLIGTLVLMEGLLSSDNALVLAVMVKRSSGKTTKKSFVLWVHWSLFIPFPSYRSRCLFN